MNLPAIEVLDWAELGERRRAELLARPVTDDPQRRSVVAAIIRAVREDGDDALARLSAQFEGTRPPALEVDRAMLQAALAALQATLRSALEEAAGRIRAFHAADRPQDRTVETAPGLSCAVRYQPLHRAGLYVPGGSAPLLSTVLMLAIPARLAGCREVVLCSPAGGSGLPAAEILAAAALCGVDRVFCAGGAQAIAAMAYGTATIPRCNKIFGPGNAWVTEAKLQVSQDPAGAAIDLPAGPSEVMVIADAAALADGGDELIAWDLLSQAEHGPDSQVLLLTDCRALAEAVAARLAALAPAAARSHILRRSLAAARIICVRDTAQALAIANDYAPEHLILNTQDADGLARQVEHAGSVFLGRWTPESLGDYCSGTNHVLPTYGWARSHGALGVADFMRRMTLQRATPQGLALAGPAAETLAGAEGLEAHRMAVRVRLDRCGAAA